MSSSEPMQKMVAWLRAELDEDERIVRAATGGPWIAEVSGETGNCVIPADAQSTREYVARTQLYAAVFDAEHIARHNPARVLREIEAKRKLLDEYASAVQFRDEAAARMQAAVDVPGGKWAAEDEAAYLRWQQVAAVLEHPVTLAASVYTDKHTFRERWAL